MNKCIESYYRCKIIFFWGGGGINPIENAYCCPSCLFRLDSYSWLSENNRRTVFPKPTLSELRCLPSKDYSRKRTIMAVIWVRMLCKYSFSKRGITSAYKIVQGIDKKTIEMALVNKFLYIACSIKSLLSWSSVVVATFILFTSQELYEQLKI